VTVKMTPVKAAILGFRTVPHNHKDIAALDLMCNLLSNPEQSGFIDRLTADGKLLMAYVLPLTYNDHGGIMLAIVPKIIGQSISQAKALVWNEINKIKKGNFDESLLEAAKINMLKTQKTIWENNEERVIQMLESFSQNITWGEYLKNLEAINQVKKEDIIRVANTYIGENYLEFVSKMGFPKKEKLPKPGFIPVVPDKEAISEFYVQWKNKHYESQNRESKIQDYNISLTSVKGRVTLKRTENPFNNIFTTTIRYGIGYYDIPELKYAAQYFNMIGTNKMSNDEIRKRMYALGCSYNFTCTENEFIVSIEGLENNLEEALKLISQLVQNPKAEKLKDKKLIENIFAEHKIMSREPNYVSQGLQEYVLYGNKSTFLNTLDKKQIKSLNGNILIAKAKEAFKYEATIHYVGQRSIIDVKEVFSDNYKFEDNLLAQKGTIVREQKKYNDNLIFIVNKKGAMQSQINFNIEGDILDLNKVPTIDAFNQYFGNDMSSLIFQEIREFRSLAYSAYGRYNVAPLKGKNNRFNAYIGCQADKTEDALEAMMNIIRNMPEKPERMDGIKSALVLSAQTTRPEFRNVISNVERWYDKGYTENPFKSKIPAYK
ncbi:MAG: insulinase family protein, partial [Bacteroidia bacterium]